MLAVLSIVLGPFCLLLRGHEASRIEQLLYVLSIFPLGLFALQVRYWEGKRIISAEPDAGNRQQQLGEWHREHHALLLYWVLGMIVTICLYGWIIFIWKQ